uniref:Uncharacterized protein n=1 Tax=Marmota marmota marmota TaxID=9994 RepID=A0A8C5YQ59_MARMA
MNQLWNIRHPQQHQTPQKWVPILGELQKTLQKGNKSWGPRVRASQSQPADHRRGCLPARPDAARHPADCSARRGQGRLRPRSDQVPSCPHPCHTLPHLQL